MADEYHQKFRVAMDELERMDVVSCSMAQWEFYANEADRYQTLEENWDMLSELMRRERRQS
jgi:hypothetical protein